MVWKYIVRMRPTVFNFIQCVSIKYCFGLEIDIILPAKLSFLSWLVNKGSKKVIKVNQVLSSRNIVRISIKLYATTKD